MSTTSIPFVRQFGPGAQGFDVLAVKRGLAKAGKGSGVNVSTDTFGASAQLALKSFKVMCKLDDDAIYTSETQEYLDPFFDAYGISLLTKEQALLNQQEKTLQILQDNGTVNASDTIRAASYTDLSLWYGCALVEKESGGGYNLWGHDDTIFIGGYDAQTGHNYGDTVTEAAYKAYLVDRGPTGAGGMQGCGPTQLTYYSYQDKADTLGGCWIPLYNMEIGFGILKNNIALYGEEAGAAAYNGTGPAAQAYGADFVVKAAAWKKLLQAVTSKN